MTKKAKKKSKERPQKFISLKDFKESIKKEGGAEFFCSLLNVLSELHHFLGAYVIAQNEYYRKKDLFTLSTSRGVKITVVGGGGGGGGSDKGANTRIVWKPRKLLKKSETESVKRKWKNSKRGLPSKKKAM